MKRLEELKNKIDSLENKYEGFREGVDYTVSVDKKGKKIYDIHSEQLRKSVFGNFREEGVISPYLQRGLEDNQNRQIFPADTPFWNEVWGKNNNPLEESGSSKIKELERAESTETSKETRPKSSQVDSGSQQTEVPSQIDYQKWLEAGIAIIIPVLFSLFFSHETLL